MASRTRPTARRLFKKRKMAARPRALTRSMVQSRVHSFTRQTNVGTIAGNALYQPYLAATGFTLGSLPQVSDFGTLYDQYKVTHLQYRFHLRIDPGAQPAATAFYPRLFYCPDYDDTTAPASLDELRERGQVKQRVLLPNKDIIVNIKPAVLNLVYRTAIASSYSPKWKQWIDMNNTDVPHYGLKWAIDLFNNTDYRLDVEVKAWFQCKNTR